MQRCMVTGLTGKATIHTIPGCPETGDNHNSKSHQSHWHTFKHAVLASCFFLVGVHAILNSSFKLWWTAEPWNSYDHPCRSARASKSSWIFSPQESLQLGFWRACIFHRFFMRRRDHQIIHSTWCGRYIWKTEGWWWMMMAHLFGRTTHQFISVLDGDTLDTFRQNLGTRTAPLRPGYSRRVTSKERKPL